jgi:hypothetical protein
MLNLKVTILRSDFVGETLVEKANGVLSYNDALLSLLSDVDLLKIYGLLLSHISSLKTTIVASAFAKAKQPYAKLADNILKYLHIKDTTIGFFVSDLGIENFLLEFVDKKMYVVNPNDQYLKLISLFPGLIQYLKFDYETFKNDLVNNRIADLNLDILRAAVGNNFILETSTSDINLFTKKSVVDGFDFRSVQEVE